MNDEARKEPVEDRAKKRREYLGYKGKALALAIFGGCAAISLVLLGVFAVIDLLSIGEYVGAFCIALFLGVLASFFGLLGRSAVEEAQSRPLVPPVREQIATLPAEEVLLRGTDRPAAAPDDLLRAAHAITAAPAAELLRADEVRSDEELTRSGLGT